MRVCVCVCVCVCVGAELETARALLDVRLAGRGIVHRARTHLFLKLKGRSPRHVFGRRAANSVQLEWGEWIYRARVAAKFEL